MIWCLYPGVFPFLQKCVDFRFFSEKHTYTTDINVNVRLSQCSVEFVVITYQMNRSSVPTVETTYPKVRRIAQNAESIHQESHQANLFLS